MAAFVREGKAAIKIKYGLVYDKRKKDENGIHLTMKFDKKDLRKVKRCCRKLARTLAYLKKNGFKVYADVEVEDEN